MNTIPTHSFAPINTGDREEVRHLHPAHDIHFSDLRDHPNDTMRRLALELDDSLKRLLAEGATRVCVQWRDVLDEGTNPDGRNGSFVVTGFRPKHAPAKNA